VLQVEAQQALRDSETAENTVADAEGPPEDDMSDWRRRLGNVARRWEQIRRTAVAKARTSAGLALLRLEAIPW
jgi:hypothetical protein